MNTLNTAMQYHIPKIWSHVRGIDQSVSWDLVSSEESATLIIATH